MARKSSPGDVNAKLEEVKRFLADFETEIAGDELRKKVLALVPVYRSLRDLGSSLIPKDIADSARDRILSYFRKYPFQIIGSEEISVVAGISEWGRRLRELRTQQGWLVISGGTIRQMIIEGELNPVVDGQTLGLMKPDDYILISDEQDLEASYRWHLANTIRKRNRSVKDRMIEYLRANVGKRVTGDELVYVAKGAKEWARRLRELRTEEGWPIATKFSGAPDLPVGIYVLEEDKQSRAHDRNIPDSVRVAVLTRDNFCCTNPECRWDRSKMKKEDPRRFLELHHYKFHSKGGENTLENLLTLCNVCHDDVHSGRLEISWG